MSELQFIISSPKSAGPGTTESQKTMAHSHAARSAHARKRRLRTIQYQAQKRQRQHQQHSCLVSVLPATRADPFMSFARSLDPLESMLFDHYVTVIIPLMRCMETASGFYRRMTTIWVPRATAEASLLDLLFLASCRHLAARYGVQEEGYFGRLSLQYKLRCLRSLQDAIVSDMPLLSDSTISQAIMLAYDELFVCDERMLKHHVQGAIRMVELNGGLQSLGLDGLLAHFLSNLVWKTEEITGLHLRIPLDTKTNQC
ncbi:hypothetical protein BJX96DRAFT_36913 [Aspergillus floccosus]